MEQALKAYNVGKLYTFESLPHIKCEWLNVYYTEYMALFFIWCHTFICTMLEQNENFPTIPYFPILWNRYLLENEDYN